MKGKKANMKLRKLIGLANAMWSAPSFAIRKLIEGKFRDFRGVMTYRDFLEMRRFAKKVRGHDALLFRIWSGSKIQPLPLP
jgi:hypothetical protein